MNARTRALVSSVFTLAQCALLDFGALEFVAASVDLADAAPDSPV